MTLALQWLKHHTLVSCFHEIRVHILQDIWLPCNTSVMRLLLFYALPSQYKDSWSSRGSECWRVLHWPKKIHMYSAHSPLTTTYFMALPTARSLGQIGMYWLHLQALVTLLHLSTRKNYSLTSLAFTLWEYSCLSF